MLLRKDAAGGTDPTYDIELWEAGGGSALATLASGVTISSETGTVVSVTWDASSLATADGSAVEVRVVGRASVDRSVEVGALEWLSASDEVAGAGFYFLRARYYDPATGRFLSRDPVEFEQRYAYGDNNPVLFVDPTGLCSLLETWKCADEALDLVFPDEIASVVPFNGIWNRLFAWTSSCGSSFSKEGITFHLSCRGLAESFLLGTGETAFTLGRDVYTYEPGLSSRLMRHEACHVGQYDGMGDMFLPLYIPFDHGTGAFEDQADSVATWALGGGRTIGDARARCAAR